MLETMIAFANEPGLGGGCLLLGVEWSIDAKGDTVYRPEGVPDPDKLQQDLATQCAGMLSFPLRPEIAVERIDGKTLVVVQVAEVDHGHKPVYLKATGLPRGAFRRIGSTDQRCTDEDLWVLRGDTRPRTGLDQGIANAATGRKTGPGPWSGGRQSFHAGHRCLQPGHGRFGCGHGRFVRKPAVDPPIAAPSSPACHPDHCPTGKTPIQRQAARPAAATMDKAT